MNDNPKPQETTRDAQPGFAGAQCSAATSELSAIINAARERGCAEHGHEIKWLIELPMTDEEAKRFNDLTGWPSRKQPNSKAQRPLADSDAGRKGNDGTT
jgi:hypothetical protein